MLDHYNYHSNFLKVIDCHPLHLPSIASDPCSNIDNDVILLKTLFKIPQ